MRKIIFIIVVFICANISLKAQDLNFYNANWRSETSMYNANDGVFDSKNRFWCATDGGVYCANLSDSSVKYIRNTDGLLLNEISAIEYIPDRKEIILGASDGTIEIINEETFEITHILDIQNFGLTNPKINDIVYHNGIVYFATGYGISSFNPTDRTIIESVTKLGDFSQFSPVIKLDFNRDTLWAITEAGLTNIYAQSNLLDRKNWKNYSSGTEKLKGLKIFHDSVYTISDSIIYKYYNNSLITKKSSHGAPFFTGIFEHNDSLCYSNEWVIKDFSSDMNIFSPPHISNKIFSRNNKIVIFYNLRYSFSGVSIIDETYQTKLVKLNCPLTNMINDVKVDSKGVVWAAINASGNFMSLKDNNWKVFKSDSSAGRSSDRIWPGTNGNVYASFYGSGLGVLTPDYPDSVILFNEKNSKFTGYQADAPSWILIGDIKEDNSGLVYAVNWSILSGPMMLAFDNKLNASPLYNKNNISFREFSSLVIDANNIKWLGSTEKGVYALNDNNTIDNTDDDVITVLNSSNNSVLANDVINDLAMDKDGTLWIATSTGPYALINPSYVMSKSVKPVVRKVKQMTNVPINRISVDALNQKWFATNSGVWIMSADASEALAQITTDNSPLLSNTVKTITFNNQSGEVYIGTEKGLSIFNSLSIEPSGDYAKLKCYPQPYNPEKDGYLFIEGMAKSARIKIITLSGEEVNSIDTESDKAIWDGKDKNGAYAPNGIYLIVSDSKEAGKSGIVKAAILRK